MTKYNTAMAELGETPGELAQFLADYVGLSERYRWQTMVIYRAATTIAVREMLLTLIEDEGNKTAGEMIEYDIIAKEKKHADLRDQDNDN